MSKKIIRITESELINLVKRVIKEAAPEPVIVKGGKIFGDFIFEKGKTKPEALAGRPVTSVTEDNIASQIARYMESSGTYDVLLNVYNQTPTGVPKLPKFIYYNVGTSTSGSDLANANVARERTKYFEGIIRKALDKLNVDDEIIESIIITNRDTQYTPAPVDRLTGRDKAEEKAKDRFGRIEIKQLAMKGLERSDLMGVGKGLKNASSLINSWIVDNVDEGEIVKQIEMLGSPSDVKELNELIASASNWNSLEDFLNDQLFDDPNEKNAVVNHLDNIAVEFFGDKAKGTVRKDSKNNISIGQALIR
jgi:hypothetical protein